MNKHKTIGIDLAKSSFYLVTLNSQGKREGKTKLTRPKLLNFMVQQPACTVAMEACASSHHWAREIQKLGHRVQLLPAQHVKVNWSNWSGHPGKPHTGGIAQRAGTSLRNRAELLRACRNLAIGQRSHQAGRASFDRESPELHPR